MPEGKITSTLKEFKSLIGLVLLLMLVFIAGYGIHYYASSSEYELLLSEQTALINDIKISKNKTQSLDTLLKKEKSKSKEDRGELLSIIKSLNPGASSSMSSVCCLCSSSVNSLSSHRVTPPYLHNNGGYSISKFRTQ